LEEVQHEWVWSRPRSLRQRFTSVPNTYLTFNGVLITRVPFLTFIPQPLPHYLLLLPHFSIISPPSSPSSHSILIPSSASPSLPFLLFDLGASLVFSFSNPGFCCIGWPRPVYKVCCPRFYPPLVLYGETSTVPDLRMSSVQPISLVGSTLGSRTRRRFNLSPLDFPFLKFESACYPRVFLMYLFSWSPFLLYSSFL